MKIPFHPLGKASKIPGEIPHSQNPQKIRGWSGENSGYFIEHQWLIAGLLLQRRETMGNLAFEPQKTSGSARHVL